MNVIQVSKTEGHSDLKLYSQLGFSGELQYKDWSKK